MEITYKTRKLQKVCTNAREAEKAHGTLMAEKIQQRIDEISAVETLAEMLQYRIGGCHRLLGRREGQYALTLIQPYRLVFEMVEDKINVVCILEIVDYH